MPIYLSGYILIVIFAGGGLDIFPTGGSAIPNRPDIDWNLVRDGNSEAIEQLRFNIEDDLLHLVLPLIALTFFSISFVYKVNKIINVRNFGSRLYFSCKSKWIT